MIHDCADLADEDAVRGDGVDRRAALSLACLGGSRGSGAKHHALAQHQYRVAGSEQHRSADRSEHRRRCACRPGIAGTAETASGRTSSALHTCPACSYAYRDSTANAGSAGHVGRRRGNGGASGKSTRQRPAPQCIAAELRSASRAIANEIVAEIDGTLSDAQADALARRHGLTTAWIAEFSADRAPPSACSASPTAARWNREPRIRRRRQRSLGAAELPLLLQDQNDGIDRGRSRAICAGETSLARRRIRWPTAPMSPSP